LNRTGARYVVVGGFAVILQGYTRFTTDIDLLIETTPENEARVFQALMSLPDQAVRELVPGDVGQSGVIRVFDDIVVDLMQAGCGVTYAEASQDADLHDLHGVRFPIASVPTLWKMKQTVREKDIPDRIFLRQRLASMGIQVVEPRASTPAVPGCFGKIGAWLDRAFGKLSSRHGRGKP
jgi:hypothetical protein